MKMSVWSLACQQSVFQRYHSKKISKSFTHTMAAKASWQWHYVTVTLCTDFHKSRTFPRQIEPERIIVAQLTFLPKMSAIYHWKGFLCSFLLQWFIWKCKKIFIDCNSQCFLWKSQCYSGPNDNRPVCFWLKSNDESYSEPNRVDHCRWCVLICSYIMGQHW